MSVSGDKRVDVPFEERVPLPALSYLKKHPKTVHVTKMKVPNSDKISEAGLNVVKETNVYHFDSSDWFGRMAKQVQRLTNLLNMIGGWILTTLLNTMLGPFDEARAINGKHVLLHRAGAEHVQIQSDTGCIVDAHYLDAAKFVENLERLGGARGRFQLQLFEDANKKYVLDTIPERMAGEFSGFRFPKAASNIDEVKEIFKEFGEWDSLWTYAENKEELFIVHRDDIHKINQYVWGRCALQTRDRELKEEGGRGVVLLSQGLFPVYEGNLAELFAFALEGLNVMVYNAPGKGLSEGVMDKENVNAAIEASYQFLSAVKHIPDEKILAKGLCFGSAPTAWLGRKYPQINLMLDQSPANVRDLVPEAINTLAQFIFPEEKQPESIQDHFYSAVANLLRDNQVIQGIAVAIFKGYHVAEDLRYNEGHKLLHIAIPHIREEGDLAGGDTFIPEDHPTILFNAAKEMKDKALYLTVNPAGHHSERWWDDHNWRLGIKGPTCYDDIKRFLKEADLQRDIL